MGGQHFKHFIYFIHFIHFIHLIHFIQLIHFIKFIHVIHCIHFNILYTLSTSYSLYTLYTLYTLYITHTKEKRYSGEALDKSGFCESETVVDHFENAEDHINRSFEFFVNVKRGGPIAESIRNMSRSLWGY